MKSSAINQYSDEPRHLVISSRKQYHDSLRKKFSKKAKRPPKPAPPACLIQEMRMMREVFDEIKETIGNCPAESGGILLSETCDYTITCFILDIAALQNSTVYQPNTTFLNSVLKGRNHHFVGLAHSHKGRNPHLSQQDKNAAYSNTTSPGNPHLNAYLMPLVQTIPDTGQFKINPFIVTCHPAGNGRVNVHRVKLKIIDD